MCSTVEFDTEDSPCPSMDFLIKDAVVGDFPAPYLDNDQGVALYMGFVDHFWRDTPVDDGWYALLEQAFDNYIASNGIAAESK